MTAFQGASAHRSIVRGTVRNVSFNGVAVVLDVATNVDIGTAVEARIDIPGERRQFLAGMIAYCRLGPDCTYEVGIKVEAVGQGPILSADVEAAKAQYPWFANSLGCA